jgi:hypothetical protein
MLSLHSTAGQLGSSRDFIVDITGLQTSTDEVQDITPHMEARFTKRRRSTAEVEEGDSKRRSARLISHLTLD